ncbi:MAG: hypothetical protein GTO14_02085 [Anaerolineales bacterium]|nr:hypothetical protein [Anaerolineales bacterium]
MSDQTPNKILRFTISDRIEHWLLVASFSTLAVSGLVQKFATAPISEWIIARLGGIESVRIIHRLAAAMMMLEAVYHIGIVAYKLFVRRSRPSMLPALDDVRKAIQSMLYNLGLGEIKPHQGRFTFEEKIEYWAVVWGTVLMAITGFMMWNPIATTRILPGEVIPAAKAAHGGEALLAVLAVIVWHLYHVHIRQFNKSMFSGFLSEEEMIEEHPLELADLKAGVAERPLDPIALARRKRIFMPVYGVIAVMMLIAIYAFTTFEETAIKTLPPPEQVVVYSPLTPTPLPTPLPSKPPAPDLPTTWEGFLPLFTEKCGLCHGDPNSLGGLNLSDYQAALAGGDNGPAIVPGDPETSLLVFRQATGDHPGQLSGDELAAVRRWIEAGAPEN